MQQSEYMSKLDRMWKFLPHDLLEQNEVQFIRNKASHLFFTHQELKKLMDLAVDLRTWGEQTLPEVWPENIDFNPSQRKQTKLKILNELKNFETQKRIEAKSYENFNLKAPDRPAYTLKEASKESKVLGSCPVASEKTRCCNLMTLDLFQNCGLDCSYCSIQSFFHENQVFYETNLTEKLNNLNLDPNKIYHIGTGQSSDSLMWGNSKGALAELFDFVEKHPNIILELKTKSKNITYLLENDFPKNVITTWSMNTPTIIKNEEHHSASFDERLNAAKQIADKGHLVGFHFHPIVYYDNWEKEYLECVEKIVNQFEPEQVALISLGTLTFIKPVLKKIRSRDFTSKISQMPMVDASGKLSYPLDIKLNLFQTVYNAFSKWHSKVFFYLCMEDQSLWEPVFGHIYETNDEFEEAMKSAYLQKIRNLK